MRKLIDADWLEDWQDEPVVRYLFVPFISGFISLFVIGAPLDNLTSLATGVWVLIVLAIPFVMMAVPSLANLSKRTALPYRGREMYDQYMTLSKDEKKMFPPNTLELLKVDEYDTEQAFGKLYGKVVELRRLKGPQARDAVSAFNTYSESIDHDLKTFRELG